MGATGSSPRVKQSIDLDNRFVREATELIAFQVPVGLVAVDGVGNSVAGNPGSDNGSIQATDGVADDLRAVGAGSLLHIVKLHDFTLGETGAEVLNHSDFSAQEDGVDVAVGLGDHKGSDFQGLAVGGDDVGVVHFLACLRVKLRFFHWYKDMTFIQYMQIFDDFF